MDKIVKFEIPVDNIERAAAFYKTVFGWNAEKFQGSDEYFNLKIVDSDQLGQSNVFGAINGGMQKRGQRAVMPTFVIKVADIGETITKIKAKGGKIAVQKADIAGKGYYAQFDDPEGRRFGIFQRGE